MLSLHLCILSLRMKKMEVTSEAKEVAQSPAGVSSNTLNEFRPLTQTEYFLLTLVAPTVCLLACLIGMFRHPPAGIDCKCCLSGSEQLICNEVKLMYMFFGKFSHFFISVCVGRLFGYEWCWVYCNQITAGKSTFLCYC